MEEEKKEAQDWGAITKCFKEYDEISEKKRDSFEKAFAALIVAAFAFSIQFSSSLGKRAICLLVASWVFYFIASIFAWVRVYLNVEYSEENTLTYGQVFITKKMKLEERVKKLGEKRQILVGRNLLFFTPVVSFLLALFFNFLFATINVWPVNK